MSNKFDFIIIGAGIMGLSIARELKKRHPNSKIALLEKESVLGLHSSGRNSGVLHSGIYYKENSIKAKVCVEGARELADYCFEFKLPIQKIGKLIIPTNQNETKYLDLLFNRAKNNGVSIELINEQQLKELEPETQSINGQALFSPNTAVIEPIPILEHIAAQLSLKNTNIFYNQRITNIDPDQSTILSSGETYSYSHLFNTAGLFADKIANSFHISKKYSILPFKGLYFKLSKSSKIKINHLIYPIPDLNVPFLGVHFTKKLDGDIYVGPTAIPAFGRENYHGFNNINLFETSKILYQIFKQYISNRQGFRKFTHQEAIRFFKPKFTSAAQKLIPNLRMNDLDKSDKVGIRAQLVDLESKELVMDFLIEHDKNSTHILNAVSPAFTSAFSFSKMVIDESKI